MKFPDLSRSVREDKMLFGFALAIRASIMLVVFAIGLETTWANAMFLFRQPALLIKSLIARNVAMPLIAILLVKTFPVHPVVKGAIVLLSITPVPPVLPAALVRAGARASYACGLLFSHSVLAVVLVPVTVELMNLVFGTHVHFGPLPVAKIIGLAIVLPLVAGMIVRHFLPAAAPRAARLIGAAGTILLLIAILPLLVLAWQAFRVLAGHGALLAMALFVIGGLAMGQALGGPEQGDRTALAVATASRHPGIALGIAVVNFPSQAKLAADAFTIYLLIGALLFVPYNLWRRKTSRDDLDSAAVAART